MGNSNLKYLENLYLDIPKYLNNYKEKKDISNIFKNQNFLYGYEDNESKKKNYDLVLPINDSVLENELKFAAQEKVIMENKKRIKILKISEIFEKKRFILRIINKQEI